MRKGRVIFLYAALVAAFWGVLCRLYWLASNTAYAGRSLAQTVTTLPLPALRGDFYDRNGTALTGGESCWYALCVPGESSYIRLFDCVSAAQQQLLYQKRNAAAPFLVQVDRDLTGEGIYTVARTRRYTRWPLCMHLIGYLDGEGHGVTGLEAALDDRLYHGGERSYVQCVTNARGALMQDTRPSYYQAQSDTVDVVLTIDHAVQAAVEGIGGGMLQSGCIAVLDVETAQVLACASFPSYTPDTVADSIQAGEGALVNRAFSAYAVGSVFKPVLAAAALEQKALLIYDCPGYVQVGDHIYRCAGGVPHGPVDLAKALAVSCNGYFVTLGQQLGAGQLVDLAGQLGFGQPVYLAGGLKAAAGNLPDAAFLADLGQLANFSFGQGALLASPVQVAAMMNTVAAGGEYRTPTFLLRTVSSQSGETIEELSAGIPAVQAMSARSAAALQEMLAGVVAEGLGSAAQPTWGEAAGKTGTAQTGRFDAAGEEYKNLWFAGFYPVDAPRYTVVVMQDDQTKAAHSSAAVFARVCDALALLDGTAQTLSESPSDTAENS